jgi:hypothetical protein
MSRLLPLVLLLPMTATAGPVPKAPKETDQQKLERLFGFSVDPDKDCKFTLTGENKLRVQLSAAAHPIDPGRELTNTPRVVRTVEGDFTARVRVTLIDPAELKPAPKKPDGLFKAGLLISAGGETFAYHGHSLFHRPGGPVWQGELGLRGAGGNQTRVSTSGNAFGAASLLVRITRIGDTLRMEAWQPEGRWLEVAKKAIPLPDRVFVGVYAANHTATPFAAEFEDFTVTPIKPGK